jgi:hypothetical protein
VAIKFKKKTKDKSPPRGDVTYRIEPMKYVTFPKALYGSAIVEESEFGKFMILVGKYSMNAFPVVNVTHLVGDSAMRQNPIYSVLFCINESEKDAFDTESHDIVSCMMYQITQESK